MPSAIVKLVVAETESAALKSYPTESNARTSANVARVKVVRAVRHNGPIAVRNARAVSDAIDLIQLDDELLDLAGELEPPLRDLDAIHLAAALELGDELEAVVTYDEWTARGAEALGLPVAAPAQVQRLPTPKRTVALRRATVNVSGTHAAAAFRRKPPVYGFHSPSELDGAHDSKRSTAPCAPCPQPIATCRLQRAGTVTSTGGLSARTTRPALLQYGHCVPPVVTVCGRYVGGTATTPSTTRLGFHSVDPPGSMMLSHITALGASAAHAEMETPSSARDRRAAATGRIARVTPHGVVGFPRPRSSTRSLGSVKPSLRYSSCASRVCRSHFVQASGPSSTEKRTSSTPRPRPRCSSRT